MEVNNFRGNQPTTQWSELLQTALLRLLGKLHFDRMPHVDWVLSPTGAVNRFTDYFKGLERVEVVKRIFGEKTPEVLGNLRVKFTYIGGYMWIDPKDGSLVISSHYLNEGDKTDIYLDLIHELVHIRQLMEGKKLFDAEYDYADRPTEIEAYQYAVDEARRIGLKDEQICEYLKTEWMSHEDLRKLAKSVNVRCK